MVKKIWKIDNEPVLPLDSSTLIWENNHFFTFVINGKKFNGEIIEDAQEKGFIKLKINHREFTIQKTNHLDDLIVSLGLDKEKNKKLLQLKSPMPGRIVGTHVQIGSQVNVGDELLTLEAMKMENVLKSDGSGIVKSIEVSEQEVVDKGKVLLTFE
jgi:biotin carboxyl carrier protein